MKVFVAVVVAIAVVLLASYYRGMPDDTDDDGVL